MKKNVSIYIMAIISKFIVVVLSLVSSAMINRLLGVELKGEYAYINNIVAIISVIVAFGLGQTYSTYKRKYKDIDVLGTFILLILIQSIIVLITSIILYILKANYIVFYSTLITAFAMLRTNLLYITAIENIKKRDYLSIIYKLIYMLMVLIVFLNNYRSLEIMLFLLIIDDLIIICGSFIRFRLKINCDFLKKYKKKILEIYKYGFVSMIMYLLITLNYNLDIIMLKNLSTQYSVGIYSVAVSLANMLWLIPDAFKDIIVNKTAKNDSIKEIVFLTKINIYISIVIIIAFYMLGEIFIKILYGIEFIDSYKIAMIIFIGNISMIIYKLIHPLYVSNGKQKIIVNILIVSIIANTILNLVLIPVLGVEGAAWASVVSYSICSYILLLNFCKSYDIKLKEFILIRKEELNKIRSLI